MRIEKIFLVLFIILISVSVFSSEVYTQDCILSGPEIPDNSLDEDCDGWLGTTLGFKIRATHPRVLLDADKLKIVIDRMYGPNARDPYKRWFNLIKQKEDSGEAVDFVNLALIYKATKNPVYKERFISRIPTTGTPSLEELYGLDIMFDEISDDIKRTVMRRVSENPDSWYWHSVALSNATDASWGYHAAPGVAPALAYSGIFALTPVELNKDPAIYKFNTLNYIRLVSEELSPNGYFWRIENRIAGDPTYNDALPGSFGGMYDNFGYDSSEESYSIHVIASYSTLTGEDRFSGFLHDKYRARFYQNMQYPHLYSRYDTNQWCHKAGTEMHTSARIWNTQTDYITQPASHAVARTASLYKDSKMQYYANNGVWTELCGYAYNGMYWSLIFYDDTLSEDPPSNNPTAMYFNGPGLVSMRENWSNDAAFAVFIAGEGISRRYEDANSFLLSRKVDIIPHGGARIRHSYDNDKHHWYHIRSISKNTLKIFDPLESFDLNKDGTTGPLHTGTRLVASDNMGGQIFETAPSTEDKCYYAPDSNVGYGCTSSLYRSGSAFPLGVYETANVIKYEHVSDDYTYTVGDGTAAYTKKIDFFEREFLFLRPDIFVIFDRIKSVDPSYKKAWVIHTVDEPVVAGTPTAIGMGMKAYEDARESAIYNPKNIAYIDSLLPKQNRIVVRGGDTILTSGQPLRPGVDIDGSKILESDIPRWLEIFAVGKDITGSLTLYGDAEEGDGTSEAIAFDGTTVQTYLTSRPTSAVTGTQLQDTTQNWQPDQWKGYMVQIRFGSSSTVAIITGNNNNTLFGSFTSGSSWSYTIQRPLANSYKHWKKITRIITSDMDVDELTISIPHYFDAEDANGRLHSFAPHTDSKNDGYRKRKDLGQWTFNIEAAEPKNLDNFLNVISLKDPGLGKSTVSLFEGTGVSGVLVDSYFAVFANDKQNLSSFNINISKPGLLKGLFLDLIPNTTYYYVVNGNTVSVSTTDNGGQSKISSAMGTLKVSLFPLGLLGDVNNDGKVDIKDLIMIAKDFGKTSGFNLGCDLNGDARVDIKDLIIVAKNFGKGQ